VFRYDGAAGESPKSPADRQKRKGRSARRRGNDAGPTAKRGRVSSSSRTPRSRRTAPACSRAWTQRRGRLFSPRCRIAPVPPSWRPSAMCAVQHSRNRTTYRQANGWRSRPRVTARLWEGRRTRRQRVEGSTRPPSWARSCSFTDVKQRPRARTSAPPRALVIDSPAPPCSVSGVSGNLTQRTTRAGLGHRRRYTRTDRPLHQRAGTAVASEINGLDAVTYATPATKAATTLTLTVGRHHNGSTSWAPTLAGADVRLSSRPSGQRREGIQTASGGARPSRSHPRGRARGVAISSESRSMTKLRPARLRRLTRRANVTRTWR